MIFFNKNTKQDKQFLELQTRLNYAYWVASDAHHYFENSENNINTYEYKELLKQFNSSIEMAEDISISSFYIQAFILMFNSHLLIITPSIHLLLSTETLIDLTSHVLYTPLAIFATIGRSH